MPSKETVAIISILTLPIISNTILNTKIPINADVKRALGYPEDSLLNFTELAQKYGYKTEEHTAVTEDGYMLKIFRIEGKRCRRKRTPVILMHGLLQSSDVFLDAGPKAGLAYLLADACHDLWVANARGNYYSRRHVTLDPDRDGQFWKFCIDEIGLYDVPATIDYVLQQTGVAKLNYIGFSQGAGSFCIMCSERPGYCDKVNILIGLAPATRMTHTKSLLFRFVAEHMYLYEGRLRKLGVHEVFSKGQIMQELLAFFCPLTPVTDNMCDLARSLLDSFHEKSITNATRRNLFGHFPAGTSLHNMARYGQSMMSEKFSKFDYGANNINVYNSDKPPIYNMSAVSVPVVIIYGQNDGIVDMKDVEWLVDKLPNVVHAALVNDPSWNHLDVTYSRYNRKLTFPKINEYLIKYSQT